MKLLHIKDGHPRNVEFIIRACQLFNIEYHRTYDSSPPDNGYDIIWAPMEWINPDHYPTSRIIFGPHFWIFPDKNDPLYTRSTPEHASRCIYLCLSDWNVKVFNEFIEASKQIIPHVAMPFGLHIDTQIKTDYEYDCIIYYKARHPSLLEFCIRVANEKGLRYKVFHYGSYSRDDYIHTLQRTKFVIWLGSHESQGFGLEECLATNTPIFIYDALTMKDEFINGRYSFGDHSEQLLATSAPYWNDQCGIKVRSHDEFIRRLPEFMAAIPSYTPAEYVQRTLTDRVCFQRFMDALHIQL